jgi:gamma-glutamylputrescine oxidase
MLHSTFRHLSLVGSQASILPNLQADITTDVCVIWGGVAGLHAALELRKAGKEVVLLEKYLCGSGMSGRSGGFLTPDSELGLRQLEQTYGKDLARELRDFWEDWQQAIVQNIKSMKLDCDLRQQDSLLLGFGTSGKEAVAEEYDIRKAYQLQADKIMEAKQIHQRNTGCCYSSALRYDNCYGINPMKYCQELKAQLLTMGVKIFECSEVWKIEKTKISTNLGSVTFKNLIVCPGKIAKNLSKDHAKQTYGIKNFLAISEPLSDEQIRHMMPWGPCMCWDTQLVFSYYRIVEGNRLILGGGNAISSFLPFEFDYDRVIKHEVQQFKKLFPALKHTNFQSYRSGRIEVAKDIMPIVDVDAEHNNHIRVQGAAGLPRAAACGKFAVELLHTQHNKNLAPVFSATRSMLIPYAPSSNFMKSLVWGVCNGRAMGVI